MRLSILGLSHESEARQLNQNISALSSHAFSISQCTATTQGIVQDLQNAVAQAKEDSDIRKIDPSGCRAVIGGGMEMVLQNLINDALRQFFSDHRQLSSVIQATDSKPVFGPTPKAAKEESEKYENNFQNSLSRKVQLQVLHRHVYRMWLVTIIITCISTAFQDTLESSNENEKISKDTSTTRTVIEIRPHPWINSRSMAVSTNRQRLGTSPLQTDFRLRTYRYSSWDSPILKALETGNVSEAHKLFATGESTPFDVFGDSQVTILKVAFDSWLGTLREIILYQSPDDSDDKTSLLKRKFDMFVFLVKSWTYADDQLDQLPYYLYWISECASSCPLTLTPHIADRCDLTSQKPRSTPSISKIHIRSVYFSHLLASFQSLQLA